MLITAFGVMTLLKWWILIKAELRKKYYTKDSSKARVFEGGMAMKMKPLIFALFICLVVATSCYAAGADDILGVWNNEASSQSLPRSEWPVASILKPSRILN
jgi:hypothetical protein